MESNHHREGQGLASYQLEDSPPRAGAGTFRRSHRDLDSCPRGTSTFRAGMCDGVRSWPRPQMPAKVRLAAPIGNPRAADRAAKRGHHAPSRDALGVGPVDAGRTPPLGGASKGVGLRRITVATYDHNVHSMSLVGVPVE